MSRAWRPRSSTRKGQSVPALPDRKQAPNRDLDATVIAWSASNAEASSVGGRQASGERSAQNRAAWDTVRGAVLPLIRARRHALSCHRAPVRSLRQLGPSPRKWCPGAESNHRHGDFQSARSSGQVLVRQEESALSQHRRIANASKERTSDGWAVARNMGVHLAHRGALSRADASRWWRWHRVRTDSPGNPGDESAQDSRVDVSGS